MAGSDGKQAGVLGRLRNKRESRRQRRAEKARVQGEFKREWERSGEVDRPRAGYGGGPGGAAGG
jgi:hypothetical protein